MLEEERRLLKQTNPFVVLEYIKASFEMLIKTRITINNLDNSLCDKDNEEFIEGKPNNYELMVQSLEAEIRSRIRVEQQMKISIESLQWKLEDYEMQSNQHKRELEELRNENNMLLKKLKAKDEIINEQKEYISSCRFTIENQMKKSNALESHYELIEMKTMPKAGLQTKGLKRDSVGTFHTTRSLNLKISPSIIKLTKPITFTRKGSIEISTNIYPHRNVLCLLQDRIMNQIS